MRHDPGVEEHLEKFLRAGCRIQPINLLNPPVWQADTAQAPYPDGFSWYSRNLGSLTVRQVSDVAFVASTTPGG